MNSGFYGFPTGQTIPAVTLTNPILADIMNTNNGTSRTVRYMNFGFGNYSGSSATMTANRLYLVSHWIPRPCLLTTITCGVVLPTISGNAHFGLYTSDPTTGFPDTCIFSSGSIATATGYNQFGPSCNISIDIPGWYWGAVVFDANVDKIQSYSQNPINLLPSSSFIANYQGSGLYCSHTFGPVPPSLSSTKLTLDEGRLGPKQEYTMISRNPRNPVQRG